MQVRMPSGMQGSKHEVLEGGIRNFLAIRGPGVQQGATNWQLTGLVDVLPTLVELAGIQVGGLAAGGGACVCKPGLGSCSPSLCASLAAGALRSRNTRPGTATVSPTCCATSRPRPHSRSERMSPWKRSA